MRIADDGLYMSFLKICWLSNC